MASPVVSVSSLYTAYSTVNKKKTKYALNKKIVVLAQQCDWSMI